MEPEFINAKIENIIKNLLVLLDLKYEIIIIKNNINAVIPKYIKNAKKPL